MLADAGAADDTRSDFGSVRLVQMLWRLMFSAVLLMLVHNNPLIL